MPVAALLDLVNDDARREHEHGGAGDQLGGHAA